MVDKHGIRRDPHANEAVQTWKSAKTKHQLISFFGFAKHFREFIKGYADKTYPVQQLMRHLGKKVTWSNAAEEGVLSENKMRCVRGSVIGRASRKRHIRPTYRCLSGRDFRVTSSRGGVEWQDHLEITSVR